VEAGGAGRVVLRGGDPASGKADPRGFLAQALLQWREGRRDDLNQTFFPFRP